MALYEGGQNRLPDIPAERWRELYLEAAAELERLRADLARAEADARRWRFMKPRMLAADFDYGGDGTQALVFEMPAGFAASADADATVDDAAAIAAQGADHE